MTLEKKLQPSREAFAADPIGYSSSAWLKWGIAQTIAGFPVDISKPPTSEDLKSPILWLTQAHALTQAATALVKNQPNFEDMPINMRGVCDTQYCAVSLMLVGYSLEVCLKAMTILRSGVTDYIINERSFYHHRLVDLAEFVPNLSRKDKAVLQALTHFTLWAGRYPDPGTSRLKDQEEVFSLSEEYKIAAKDLFDLAARVMNYASSVVEETTL